MAEELENTAPEIEAPLEGAPQPEPKPSLEDTMGSVFDEIEARGDEPVETKPSSGPTRGPDGKFVKGGTEGAPGAKPAGSTPDPTSTNAAPAPSAIAPPSHWGADRHPVWATLAPEVQKLLSDDYSAHAKTLDENKSRLTTLTPIASALEPIRGELAARGLSPDAYIRAMIETDRWLQTAPQDAIPWLAKQYGLNLSQLSAQPNGQQPPADPVIAGLQQQLQQVTHYLTSQQKAAEKAQRDQVQSQIEKFKADPKNKHFETVRPAMAALINADPSLSLDQAYEQATFANPTTRALIQAEMKAAQDKAAQDEAAKKAAEATRLASTNVRQRGTSPGGTKNGKSIEDTMRARYEEMHGDAA
jgi:hypothetical protein